MKKKKEFSLRYINLRKYEEDARIPCTFCKVKKKCSVTPCYMMLLQAEHSNDFDEKQF